MAANISRNENVTRSGDDDSAAAGFDAVLANILDCRKGHRKKITHNNGVCTNSVECPLCHSTSKCLEYKWLIFCCLCLPAGRRRCRRCLHRWSPESIDKFASTCLCLKLGDNEHHLAFLCFANTPFSHTHTHTHFAVQFMRNTPP